MDDLAHLRTDRLVLRRPVDGDLAEVHALHADPRVWEHLPSGRQVLAQQTRVMLARWQHGWDEHDLGSWVVRSGAPLAAGGEGAGGRSAGGDAAGALLGVGGCDVRHGVVWNLGYRFHREVWGLGLAGELVTAARAAAAAVRPELPVVAYLLEHNRASRRTAERAGLDLVWRGPDAGNPDPAAVRLVFADRPLPAEVLARVVAS